MTRLDEGPESHWLEGSRVKGGSQPLLVLLRCSQQSDGGDATGGGVTTGSRPHRPLGADYGLWGPSVIPPCEATVDRGLKPAPTKRVRRGTHQCNVPPPPSNLDTAPPLGERWGAQMDGGDRLGGPPPSGSYEKPDTSVRSCLPCLVRLAGAWAAAEASWRLPAAGNGGDGPPDQEKALSPPPLFPIHVVCCRRRPAPHPK